MRRAARASVRGWRNTAVAIVVTSATGCAASDPHTDVVRLPDPVPLATVNAGAPSAAASAEPAPAERPRPVVPRRAPPEDSEASEHGRATDVDRARELFKQGAEAYANGDFAKACAAFEEAYRLAPVQPLLFNIGSCEMRMGHTAKACSTFRQYVQNGDPSDPRIAQVTQQLANRCP